MGSEDDRQSVAVLIPTRNERGNIAAALDRLPALGSHTEVIFVDGHSTDGTLEEIQKQAEARPDMDISWYTQDGKGKGDAVRKGFGLAKSDILMILDADLTVPPEELPKFYTAIMEGKGFGDHQIGILAAPHDVPGPRLEIGRGLPFDLPIPKRCHD